MIIDASVAFKWLINEPGSEAAMAFLGNSDLLAPNLMLAEIADALGKRIRRGELRAERATEMLGRVGELVVIVDERPYLKEALRFSVLLNHSVYDCLYLAMADGLQDRVLTADARFIGKLGKLAGLATLLGSEAA